MAGRGPAFNVVNTLTADAQDSCQVGLPCPQSGKWGVEDSDRSFPDRLPPFPCQET